MSAYILRDIPPDLWRDVKTRATADGTPLRQVILFLLRAYADSTVSLGVTHETPTLAPALDAIYAALERRNPPVTPDDEAA